MERESKVAVYAALAGNMAIAVTKFVAVAITGSAAMLSEGIHSTVDTGNELLLLLGIRRSARPPPDDEHPFGHGMELYFWSLLVAVLIFGVGGGISAYEGVLHVLHPVPLRDPLWDYAVLGCAFVFEGASLGVGITAFLRNKRVPGFFHALARSKDPALYTVIAEDSAALAGLLLAFAGVFFSHRYRMPVLDGAASIAIGVLLAGIASFLIYHCRELLVGTGVEPETARQIRELARGVEGVERVSRPLTMYFGPDNVFLALDVRFAPAMPAADVARAVERIEARVEERFPRIKKIYIEARSLEPAAHASQSGGE